MPILENFERTGDESIITTDPNADSARIAALDGGGYVITWRLNEDVYAQIYDSNNEAVGNRIEVNTITAGNQQAPEVAALKGGGFVITWEDYSSNDGGYAAQIFNADGSKSGNQIAIPALGNYSSVVALDDGGFSLFWRDSHVMGISYSANGTVTEAPFQVSDGTSSMGSNGVSAAVLEDGRILVTWDGFSDGDGYGIFGHFVSTNSSAQGHDFQINANTAGTSTEPSVAALTGGGFAVSWSTYGVAGKNDSVSVRVFDADGHATTGDIAINESTSISQYHPVTAGLEDGGFVVAWRGSEGEGSVYAQHYDANGEAAGGMVRLDDHIANVWPIAPAVATLDDSHFAVGWVGSSANVYSAIFSYGYQAVGTNGDDAIVGGRFGDVISGGHGNDTLTGGHGDDSLTGGEGADSFAFGSGWGNDTISDFSPHVDVLDFSGAGRGHDDLTIEDKSGGVLISDGSGDSVMLTGVTAAELTLGDFGETKTATAGDDLLYGTAGSNHIKPLAGDDTVEARAGDDLVGSSDGNDLIMLGDGDDMAFGGNGADTIRGDAGDDTIGGSAGNDLLIGGASDASLFTFATHEVDGADKLFGGDGNDTLVGGSWTDDGDNVVEVAEVGNGAGDGANVIWAGTGDDIAYGAGGADMLGGGVGNDDINGMGGNDTLFGGGGDAAQSDDTLSGGDGNDILYGGDGNDSLIGGRNRDLLFGGNGDDEISGGQGQDTLWGGNGNDSLDGQTDNDMLNGGNGNDTLKGGNGADHVNGGANNDVLFGGYGKDTLLGSLGDDSLSGDPDNDSLNGGDGNDTLDGGSGDDTLDGSNGDDTLDGGTGDDLLTGGDGADHFVFASGDGDDTVVDFSTTDDSLDLSTTATTFTVLADVQAAATETNINGINGLLIDTGNGDSVFLEGISAADLTSMDIIY